MGKAQKLKEERRAERGINERLKKQKNKKLLFSGLIVLIIIIVLVFGLNYLGEKAKTEKISNSIINATIKTIKGDIKIELYQHAAPKTVENFVNLSKEGFYDNTKFHRVIENFVIQGGDPFSKDDDPTNDEGGDPDYTFEDEINPKSLGLSSQDIQALENAGYSYNYELESIPHEPGVISMANSGPNTNGSQFFIILSEPQPHLNGKHTAFGRVVEGMKIVRQIVQNDIINSIEINN